MYFNKIGAFVMAIVITLSTVAYAAENPEKTDYSLIVQKLQMLDLMPTTFAELEHTATITRAQAVALIAKLRGLDNISSLETIFPDVPKKRTDSGLIQVLYEKGIVSGYPDGTFRPDEPMTFFQAAKMLVCAMNYQEQAIILGGMTDGYRMMTYRLGINPKISYKDQDTMTFGDFLTMIDSALSVDIPIETGFSNGKQMTVRDDNNLLTVYHDIYEVKGIVTANAYASLNSESGYDANFIKIDNTIYTLNDNLIWANDLLGYSVMTYYKERNDKVPEILYMEKNLQKMNIVSLDADEIVDYNNEVIYYYENGSTKQSKVELSTNTDIIYNGKVEFHPVKNTFMPKLGSVVCIDNNNDGAYEVAVIKSYRDYFVKDVFWENQSIWDYYGSDEVSFDPSKRDAVLYRNGDATASFSDIKKNTVISVAESRDKTIAEVQISNQSIEGTVTSLSSENFEIKIDQQEYKLAKSLTEENTVHLNDSGTFYLNYLGEVTGADIKTNEGMYYGYFIRAWVDKTENQVNFKLLSENGKMMYHSVSERALINGSVISSDALLELLKRDRNGTPNTEGKFVEQPIQYRINSRGIIMSIDTYLTDTLHLDYTRDNRLYTPANKTFHLTFGINSDAVIFLAPRVEDALAELSNDADYGVIAPKDLKNKKYNIEGYNSNDVGICDLAVSYTTIGGDSIEESDAYGMVSSVYKGIDEENNEMYYIDVLTSGAVKTLKVKETATLINAGNAISPVDAFKKGSIIQYNMISDTVTCIKLIIDPENLSPFDAKDSNRTQTYAIVAGRVYSKSSDYINLSYKRDASLNYIFDRANLWMCPLPQGSIHIYDRKSDQVYIAKDMSDVKDYLRYGEDASFALCKFSYSAMKETYIIN